MAVKKQNLGGARQMQKKHHCKKHGLACTAVRPNNKKMSYRCAQGCNLRRLDCVLK